VLIDWFTISAQVVNFLILVYLLKRFLYGPILRAMDRREQKIGDRLREAEKERVGAEEEAENYRRKARELDEERSRRLEALEEEIDERRQELLAEARVEIEDLREAWRSSLKREQQNFLGELKRRTAAEVVRIAGRSLAVLTGEDLGNKLLKRFRERLEALSSEEKEQWASAAKEEVTVRTSFELESSLRSEIASALREACGREPKVAFRTEPEMALGMELTARGVKLSWGLESYFESLEKKVTELLEEQAAPAEHSREEGRS
jgi:F-type H+-transporting ATPase subunit b